MGAHGDGQYNSGSIVGSRRADETSDKAAGLGLNEDPCASHPDRTRGVKGGGCVSEPPRVPAKARQQLRRRRATRTAPPPTTTTTTTTTAATTTPTTPGDAQLLRRAQYDSAQGASGSGSGSTSSSTSSSKGSCNPSSHSSTASTTRAPPLSSASMSCDPSALPKSVCETRRTRPEVLQHGTLTQAQATA